MNPLVTLFIDRSVGGKTVPDALREIGASLVLHDDIFPDPETPDTEWLTKAGLEGWVVLTKDERIRYRPAERATLIASNCLAIVLGAGNLRGVEMADLFVKAYPKIVDAAQTGKRPLLLKLGRDGKLTPIKV